MDVNILPGGLSLKILLEAEEAWNFLTFYFEYRVLEQNPIILKFTLCWCPFREIQLYKHNFKNMESKIPKNNCFHNLWMLI